MNDFTERMLRLNGKRPTARDRWYAFYRLYRLAKKPDDLYCWPNNGPMDALRILGFARYVALANDRKQTIGGRGHWPKFLRRKFLAMEQRKRKEVKTNKLLKAIFDDE